MSFQLEFVGESADENGVAPGCLRVRMDCKEKSNSFVVLDENVTIQDGSSDIMKAVIDGGGH